tara:strand:+ start:599 stop:976 length:378 start_codon:yes stop_codon:yes gene_type:complete
MANTFKVTTISSIATSAADNTSTIYTCGASNGAVVLSLLLANKHTTSIKTSVQLVSTTDNSGNNDNINTDGSNDTAYIIKDVSIDEETSLEIMSGQKYVLQNGDSLKVFGGNANVDVVLSYMEMT